MRYGTELTESGLHYAEAYAAHYTRRDLPAALQLYREVVESYPDTQEAEFSRMQVRNIVHAVVPQEELLDAEIDLARGHLEPLCPV